MVPILFSLGSVPIPSHAVFVGLGTIVAIVLGWRRAREHEFAKPELLWIIAGGLFGGALASRYGMVFRYMYESPMPTLDGFAAYGGRTLLGGLAGAYAGVVLTKRVLGIQRRVGDALVPGLALGIAIGRVGCFLSEKPGTPTTVPWGVTLSAEDVRRIPGCADCVPGVSLHPSFLYESLFLAILALPLFLITAWRRPLASWMVEGDLFKLFLLVYAVFRFGVEFVRGNPEMHLGLSGSQLFVIPAVIGFVVYFTARSSSGARRARSEIR